MNVINYKHLADSVEHYRERSYQEIEVPWYVSEEAMEVTRPSHVTGELDYKVSTNGKYLVASAEQGFIYLMMKGLLPTGYYQGVTPCYRFEPINTIHRKCFMKNELIYVTYDNKEDLDKHLDKVINDAKAFFEKVLGDNVEVIHVIQENSVINFDLMYKDQELGSYGIRNYKNLFFWVYGTGCAEPRLSIIKKL